MGSMSADGFRYDLVSYPTGAFDDTHPRRLATLAALYGLAASSAPSFEGARILELGCGSGGNLIPMAYALPQATLLGIDLAGREIEVANQSAAHLGLANVMFQQADILELNEKLGTFDFIVAHGVYSWVPPAVQDRLLWVCGNLLAEKGVAYISYNTLPGGHIRQLLDGMMKHHARHEADPMARVQKGRALANALVESISPQDTLYKNLIGAERDRISKIFDPVLFHDDLAEYNEALFLHDFVARAARHGLRYLADAEFESMHAHRFPRTAMNLLSTCGDRVEFEQYLDFLSCRTFRRTLLCRPAVQLASAPLSKPVEQMWALSYAATEANDFEIMGPNPVRFRNRAGVVVGLGEVLAKLTLSVLIAQSPRAFHFDELLAIVSQQMAAAGKTLLDSQNLRDVLSELLVTLYSGDMVELYLQTPKAAAVPSEKPLASALSRWQARTGPRVVNLWHRNLLLDDALALRMLPLLDGTRTRKELLSELSAAAVPVPGKLDAAAIDHTLNQLARLGVLCE